MPALRSADALSYCDMLGAHPACLVMIWAQQRRSTPSCRRVAVKPSRLLQVFEHLVIKSAASPVAENMGGSYMTMFSKGGFIFGIINIIGGCQAGWLAAAACFGTCSENGSPYC